MPSYDQWGRPIGGGGGTTSFDKWGRPVVTAPKPHVTASDLSHLADSVLHGTNEGGVFGHDFFGSHALGVVGHLAGDLKDTAVGFFPGAYNIAKASVEDLAALPAAPVNLIHGELPLQHSRLLARGIFGQERQMYGPLAGYLNGGGDLGKFQHNVYEHPLGPLLDVSALFTGGASIAAKGGELANLARAAETPTMAERAALTADRATGGRLGAYKAGLEKPRIITSPIEEPVHGEGPLTPGAYPALHPRYRVTQLAKGASPAMRLVQRLVDRFGEAHPNAPLLGNEGRIARHDEFTRIRQRKSVYTAQINPFQNAVAKLGKDDRFAYHLAHETTDPREAFADSLHTYQTLGHSWQLRRYMTRLAGKSWSQVDKILKDGGDPMDGSPIIDRVKHMSPELLDAVAKGRALEEQSGQTLMDAGVLDPATRELRKWLSLRVRSGARYVKDQTLAVTPLDRMREERKQLAAQRRVVERGRVQAERHTAIANDRAARLSEARAKMAAIPEPPALEELRTSQAAVDQAGERLHAAKATYYGVDHHLDNAEPVASAQEKLSATEAELRQVERDLERTKAAGVRHVDRYNKATERMLKAPPQGRAHDAAYSSLEHHRGERARIDEQSGVLFKRRNELLAQRHELTIKRDTAMRQAEQIRQREHELVAADKAHGQLTHRHEVTVRAHARQQARHERVAALHDRAAGRAAEAAQTQRELQGISDHLDESQRLIEEEMSHLGHRPPGALVSGRRDGPHGPALFGEDVGLPTSGDSGAGDLRDANRLIHHPGAIEGGTPVDELSLKRWLEVKGLEPAAVDPRAGYPGRFPHTAQEARSGGLAPGARSVTSPIEKPGMTKFNRGIRQMTARMALHPSVISRDYLRTMTYRLLVDYRDYLKGYAVPLDQTKGDGLLPGHVYFYGDRRVTIPRATREADPLARDKLLVDSEMTRRNVENLSREVVWPRSGVPLKGQGHVLHNGIMPGDFEHKTVEQLSRLGVKQIPERYAKAFLQETRSGSEVVHKFFDRPTDVWRALVLQYRPAWLVYNVVGQHLLYALSRGGTARSYLQALATEKNVDGETWVKLWKISIAKRNFKYARMIDEVAPGAMMGAFFRSQELGSARLFAGDNVVGRYLADLGDTPWSAKNMAGKAGVRTLQTGVGVVGGFGDLMSKLNLTIADDLPRRALFLSQMRRDAAVVRIRRLTADGQRASVSLEDAIRQVAKGDPSRIADAVEHVDNFLGNFTQMNHFERAYVRRLIPFYSWFKVITKLSLRLPVESPIRVRFFQLAGQVAEDNGTVPPWEAPSYLQNSLVAGPEQGGQQSVLATSSVNPFYTPVQLWDALSKRQTGTASPVQLLNPWIQSAITGLTGKDLFYGGNYKGLGAGAPGPLSYPGEAAGSFVSSLPQYRLGEQLGYIGNYKSSLYDSGAKTGHVPVANRGIPNYIWNYLGLPIKRVNVGEAESRARAGQ